MRTVNRFWVALALTAATGMPGVAFASPVSSWAGKVLRWNITSTSPALYTYVNSADSKVTAASAVAFSKWQNLTSTYIAFQAGTAGNAQITIDVVNLSNGFASGQASRTFDASGNITSCTVQLSTALVSAASNSAALEPTLTHEIGHCIGLGHSVSSSAVMSYRGGGSDPTDDDIFAVSMLYPNDDNLAYPLGCATVSQRNRPSGPGLPPGGGVEFFALAGLLFLFWRIQRRGEAPFPALTTATAASTQKMNRLLSNNLRA